MNFKMWYTFCIFLKIFLLQLVLVSSRCTLETISSQTKKCGAVLNCVDLVDYNVEDWSCIKQITNEYDRYYGKYRTKTIYSDDYELIVKITDPDFTESWVTERISNHVTKLSITYIDNYISNTLPSLKSVNDITIYNSDKSEISLGMFSCNKLPNLENLNLRNINLIALSEIGNSENVEQASHSRLSFLDLSLNRVENIPNNCFEIFPQLKTLNLSHNVIESLNILTFEGLLQLTTLDISHNKLNSIDNSFAKFINLKNLYLENNYIEKIIDFNFVALVDVEVINLSSNCIETIESNSFRSLNKLQYLYLNNNQIKIISRKLLLNNNNLNTLDLSDNVIESIESNAFEGKNITNFKIERNSLKGQIANGTFKGVFTDNLNLSGGNITTLNDKAFGYMCEILVELNVSNNEISHISYDAFYCLEILQSIDMSNNRLKTINFNMNSLKKLTMLFLRNNSIENVEVKSLNNATALNHLDLSCNCIEEIELRSFSKLSFLKSLLLSHNIIGNLENGTFDGLLKVNSIDLTFTRITSFKNNSFSGLASLMKLNASYGQLGFIQYNSFFNTGSIEILDLSHNMIEVFDVNNSAIAKVEKMYLNNNDIKYINQSTFFGLASLQLLSLSNNNIVNIELNSFADLKALRHLYLSSNPDVQVKGLLFSQNQSLNELSLDRIRVKFTLQNWNINTEHLNLQSCSISDVNKLHVFDIKRIRILNLSENKISSIDKFSFQDMDSLSDLDLSMNQISYIQPGSFLRTNRLSILNLSGNIIEKLHFGDFDGTNLKSLNLSNNAIETIDAKLLKHVKTLYLDNNIITNINFEEFFISEMSQLSIGGNRIPCKILVNLKQSNYSERYKSLITTQYLDYHSENVNGLTCESSFEDSKLPMTNYSTFNIKPFFDKLLNSIEKVRTSIDKNNNVKDELIETTKSDKELVDLIKTISDSSKLTQKTIQDFLNKTDINNISRIDYKNLEEYLKNITRLSRMNEFELNHTNYTIKGLNDINDIKTNIRTDLEIMLRTEIKALRAEFQRVQDNVKDTHSSLQSAETFTEHINGSNYEVPYFIFISVCLLLMVALYTVNIYFTYTKRRKQYRFQSSASPLQMENLE